jgi:hypothetical protein
MATKSCFFDCDLCGACDSHARDEDSYYSGSPCGEGEHTCPECKRIMGDHPELSEWIVKVVCTAVRRIRVTVR